MNFQHKSRWRISKHVLLFVIGAFVGSFSPLLLATLGLSPRLSVITEQESMLRYGGTSLLLVCLTLGTIAFSIGAAISKRFFHEPALWFSAAIGFIYSAVSFVVPIFVPIARGSLIGKLFAIWLILFSGLAVVASSKFIK